MNNIRINKDDKSCLPITIFRINNFVSIMIIITQIKAIVLDFLHAFTSIFFNTTTSIVNAILFIVKYIEYLIFITPPKMTKE